MTCTVKLDLDEVDAVIDAIEVTKLDPQYGYDIWVRYIIINGIGAAQKNAQKCKGA